MKRGLIAWDRNEIPPAVFHDRIDAFRRVLQHRGLPACVVYSDLWRSNRVRSLQNFMPYFNRALLVIPVEGPTTLICGLSPRVYKWIQSVTPIVDIRPGRNFAAALEGLAAEREWDRLGVLDEAGLPFDMHAGLMNTHLELIDVEAEAVACPALDSTEIAMRRKSAAMARIVLQAEIGYGAGRTDYELVGRLEHGLRRAGAEDIVVLIGHTGRAPRPATGQNLEDEYSVSLAVEYRGHWIRMSRCHADEARTRALTDRFNRTLDMKPEQLDPGVVVEDVSGGNPYQSVDPGVVRTGGLWALHVVDDRSPHIVHGDTCLATPDGWDLL